MPERKIIQGIVKAPNIVLYDGREIACWESAVDDPQVPVPLPALIGYKGKVVKVSGYLYRDLWEAKFEGKFDGEYQKVKGKVLDYNIIKNIKCFRYGKNERLELNLWKYKGKEITVTGELVADELYWAQISEDIQPDTSGRDNNKEAKSLLDLMRIRADNYDKIDKIKDNLGSALGYKWMSGRNTKHPSIIIFVSQKVSVGLIQDKQLIPPVLVAKDNTWCFTDVVSGEKIEEKPPVLDTKNENRIKDLCSGQIGLIGGIRLAYYEGGIKEENRKNFGTAGIAVSNDSKEIGFLTNQHIAEAIGRVIYHPNHEKTEIGITTQISEPYIEFSKWYHQEEINGLNGSKCYTQFDCGFVKVTCKESEVRSGIYGIGQVGSAKEIGIGSLDEIIGKKIISVGSGTGIQRGTIAAFSYERAYIRNKRYYTDLLIIGEVNNDFSVPGDSGKIIVTDDKEHFPIGLHWGGEIVQFPGATENEAQKLRWGYACDLGRALKLLNMEIYQIKKTLEV